MNIRKEQVEKFREIYKRKYGVEISYEQAEEEGARLIILFKSIIEHKTKL